MTDRATKKHSELTFFAFFSLTFSSMLGSGVFDIPQNISARANASAVIINWIIIAIGMTTLAWAFAYLTKKRPDIKNGIYGYAKYGFGDYVGFNSAWGYWLNALLGNASYLIYIFATLGNFLGYFGSGKHAGATIPALIGESILIWIVYALLIRGVRTSSIINSAITTIKLIALSSIIIMFIYGFKSQMFLTNLFSNDIHLGSIFTQIKSSMLVTVWDFLGIEAACIYAMYAKSMRDVARATMLSTITVLIIDSLISILPFGILTTPQIQNLQTPSTAGVMLQIIGELGGNTIRIAVLICIVGALLAWQMLSVKILFLSSHDRTMPKVLSRLNRRNVPVNSLLTSSIVLQIFVICAYFFGAIYLDMIQIATSLILVPYLLAALYAFKLIISEKRICYYELIRGLVALTYSIWLIYAGGLKYLVISSLMYLAGIGVFYYAKKEQRQKMLVNKTEKLLCFIIIITAISSLLAWHNNWLKF